ncbi:hypothetical protein [Streptomyces sp. SID12501]|uniref:Uncharacterized protein n=1 Tax=Streptomyces sp. SID12501 TaxID=2706042 RepID=A0A6B3BN24_9ACTN|nr:hypothetical protein [Streptomyces sp. SID12501]NEC85966.1 hypothetical protein [Streptomyces sp. SID12501]
MSFRIVAPLTPRRNPDPNADPNANQFPQNPQDAQQAGRRRPRPGDPRPPRFGF